MQIEFTQVEKSSSKPSIQQEELIRMIQGSIGLPKVSVEAIPEYSTVAANDIISDFAVLVRVRAPTTNSSLVRSPLDLVMVIDAGASMDGTKLEHVKQALRFTIFNLFDLDRLSLVSFSSQAQVVFPLIRLANLGRVEAMEAITRINAQGSSNIMEGLKKGAEVLDSRQDSSPFGCIIFLSDQRDDSHNSGSIRESLHLLPPSIAHQNSAQMEAGQERMYPVHTFGLGSEHDSLGLYAISDASGGVYSFVESYDLVQDAIASCIGGLVTVVAPELRLMLSTASTSTYIKSISTGSYHSYRSRIEGFTGTVNAGYLSADEEKEFLINVSVMRDQSAQADGSSVTTPLLLVGCSYRDVASKQIAMTDRCVIGVHRSMQQPTRRVTSSLDVSLYRNRFYVAESIARAKNMAEKSILLLPTAQELLAHSRSILLAMSPYILKESEPYLRLQADMMEAEGTMNEVELYNKFGRAYALSTLSMFASQRATTRGRKVPGAEVSGSIIGTPAATFMVNKSRGRV